ncbi:hypothetical protein HK104_004951 [Borealophlyctis nickersoniae]|nr:hypothetical protein HK104_004951 [Borealophlyctis nickersoniae]
MEAEFEKTHIQSARFFDLDKASDPDAKCPLMLSTEEDFGEYVGSLGISNADHVVVYDSFGIYSSPRAWWTFNAFGHRNVSVLNGGLFKWVQEGRATVSGKEQAEPREFKATLNEDMIVEYTDLLGHVHDLMYHNRFRILDARQKARFEGDGYEPFVARKRLGHIPASTNLPYQTLIDPDTKTLVNAEDIANRLAYLNVSPKSEIVTMSGTGLTAAILNLALATVGRMNDVKLYDGSFVEWASHPKSPVKKYL